MQDILSLLLLGGFLLIIWGLKRWQWKNKQKISPKFRSEMNSYMKKIEEKPLDRQVIEYDKVLDKVLENQGYYGTVGEMMKSHGSLFLSENAMWSAHKMRNKIVHEIDFSPSANILRTHISTFQKEIKFLLKK